MVAFSLSCLNETDIGACLHLLFQVFLRVDIVWMHTAA